MNILFTSASRRGYLVRYFKDIIGTDGETHASNSVVCPAFTAADYSVITPLIYDKTYIPFLIDYCKKRNISLVIPLFDIDLYILALNKKLFRKNGIHVMVSDADVIDKCNDKWKMYKFGIKAGINIPESFISQEDVLIAIHQKRMNYPIVVKPRWGMGSISIYIAENEDELRVFSKKVHKEVMENFLKYESAQDIDHSIIFQEFLQGDEYGVDIINNLQGEFVNAIVKRKLAMRAGETDSAIVCKQENVFLTAKKLSKAIGHIGNLDIDVILVNSKPYVLDMNARFGGGYPFSHMAGANFPKAIIEWVSGNIDYRGSCDARYGEVYQKDIQIVAIS